MDTTPTRRGIRSALLGLALAGLVATVGCSSSTSSQSGSGADSPSSEAAVSSGEVTASTVAAAGQPKPGGKLTYALEADTDGFDPTTGRWEGGSVIMAGTVYDPLTAYAADGTAKPYLAEKIQPSADFRTWTITLREGVRFHNDEVLDADALVLFFEKIRASPLTAQALEPIDPANPATKVDERTVTVNMTSPWAVFPNALTGQGGSVPAPALLNNPDAQARNDNPIGTGPFRIKEWDKGTSFTATRNPTYWQQGLPYLDEVEFRFIADNNARDDALESGDVNMELTTYASSQRRLGELAAQGRAQTVRDDGQRQPLFLMFNMDKAPLDDQRVRQAVAHAIDVDRYIEISGDDPSWRIKDSPIDPESPWYAPSDFPQHDAARARAIIDEVEAEKGPISFTVSTTDTTENRGIGQEFVKMLSDVGIDAQLVAVPQASYPTQMVFGQFDVAYIRQFGSPDPDGDYHWWISRNAVKPGEGRLGLNLARIRDPQIDQALDTGRQTTDEAARKQAYAAFQQRLTEIIPYVWLTESVKMIGADMRVRGITNGPLPDGSASMPVTNGVTRLTQTWLA